MFTYPNIDPVLIHFTDTIGIRWYGMMYVLGFLSFLLLGKMRARRPHSPVKPEQVDDILFYGAIGVILGGRIGEIFFYRFDQFLANPLSLFKVWEGGMSFHGGLIGVHPWSLLVWARVAWVTLLMANYGEDPLMLLGVWFFLM